MSKTPLKYKICFRFITIAAVCSFLANDFAFAFPQNNAKNPARNLAAESRFKPFSEAVGIDLKGMSGMCLVSGELRKILNDRDIRESDFSRLNQFLGQNIEIEKVPGKEKFIGMALLSTGRRFQYVVFNFKNEDVRIRAKFPDNPFTLTNREMLELGIKNAKDKEFFNGGVLGGIWFEKVDGSGPLSNDGLVLNASNTFIVEVHNSPDYGRIVEGLKNRGVESGKDLILVYPEHYKGLAKDDTRMAASQNGEINKGIFKDWVKEQKELSHMNFIITGKYYERCVSEALEDIIDWRSHLKGGRRFPVAFHLIGDKLTCQSNGGNAVSLFRSFANKNSKEVGYLLKITTSQPMRAFLNGKEIYSNCAPGEESEYDFYYWTETDDFISGIKAKPSFRPDPEKWRFSAEEANEGINRPIGHVSRVGSLIGAKKFFQRPRLPKGMDADLAPLDAAMREADRGPEKRGLTTHHSSSVPGDAKNPNLTIRTLNDLLKTKGNHGSDLVNELAFLMTKAYHPFDDDYEPNEMGMNKVIFDRLTQEIKDGNHVEVYVALLNSKIAGVICVKEAGNNIAYLRNFAVLPKYQSQGIGSALMDKVFDYCRENGILELKFQARNPRDDVDDSTDKMASVNFYRKYFSSRGIKFTPRENDADVYTFFSAEVPYDNDSISPTSDVTGDEDGEDFGLLPLNVRVTDREVETFKSFEDVLSKYIGNRPSITGYDFGCSTGTNTSIINELLKKMFTKTDFVGLDIRSAVLEAGQESGNPVKYFNIDYYDKKGLDSLGRPDFISISNPQPRTLRNFVNAAKEVISDDGVVAVFLNVSDLEQLVAGDAMYNELDADECWEILKDFKVIRLTENRNLSVSMCGQPYVFIYSKPDSHAATSKLKSPINSKEFFQRPLLPKGISGDLAPLDAAMRWADKGPEKRGVVTRHASQRPRDGKGMPIRRRDFVKMVAGVISNHTGLGKFVISTVSKKCSVNPEVIENLFDALIGNKRTYAEAAADGNVSSFYWFVRNERQQIENAIKSPYKDPVEAIRDLWLSDMNRLDKRIVSPYEQLLTLIQTDMTGSIPMLPMLMERGRLREDVKRAIKEKGLDEHSLIDYLIGTENNRLKLQLEPPAVSDEYIMATRRRISALETFAKYPREKQGQILTEMLQQYLQKYREVVPILEKEVFEQSTGWRYMFGQRLENLLASYDTPVLKTSGPEEIASSPSHDFARDRSAPRNDGGIANETSEVPTIHQMNLKSGIVPSIPEKTMICHIITDSIVPEAQKVMLNKLAIEMRGEEFKEKLVHLPFSGEKDFVAKVNALMEEQKKMYQGYKIEFDIACPSKELVKMIQEKIGIRALAFTSTGKASDLVDIEGIMLALRVLRIDDLAKLKEAYRLITGTEPKTNAKSVAEFVIGEVFVLPIITKADISRIEQLNKMSESIKQAA